MLSRTLLLVTSALLVACPGGPACRLDSECPLGQRCSMGACVRRASNDALTSGTDGGSDALSSPADASSLTDASRPDAEGLDASGADAASASDGGMDARSLDAMGADAVSAIDASRDSGAPFDAGRDALAVLDAGRDSAAPLDAGRDSAAPVDAGRDAGRDAGTDAGRDAGFDAGCAVIEGDWGVGRVGTSCSTFTASRLIFAQTGCSVTITSAPRGAASGNLSWDGTTWSGALTWGTSSRLCTYNGLAIQCGSCSISLLAL